MTGRRSWLGGLTILAAAMLLAGCGRSATCPELPEEVRAGASIPPLETPVGLKSPDTSQALVIPELTEPPRPRTREQGCLDEPPSYFPDRRVGAEAESETPPPGQD